MQTLYLAIRLTVLQHEAQNVRGPYSLMEKFDPEKTNPIITMFMFCRNAVGTRPQPGVRF